MRLSVNTAAGPALGLMVALTACGDPPLVEAPPQACAPGSLVDHAQWLLVSEGEDPFAAERSPEATCDREGFGFEPLGTEPSLEIDTGRCDHLTVRQPALLDSGGCASLSVRLWHFELTAPTDAEATLVIALGDEVAWERRLPIPSGSELIIDEVPLPGPVAAGAPVTFHLRNHGANTYALLDVLLAP